MKMVNKVMLLALGVLFLANNASAASLYIDSAKSFVSAGDTFVVNVKVNSESKPINSIEGDITVQSTDAEFEIKEFSLAGSIFGLWPRTPSLSKDGRVISFVGGVPGGFDVNGATLFNIILEAKKEGSIRISPKNIVALANDGKGTKVPVTLEAKTIKVNPSNGKEIPNDEWSEIVAKDITPPEEFVVVLGKDDSLFDGKKFAFFSALDEVSGVSYYEVSENGGATVRSGSTYVLQNQDSSRVKLDVTAYDKAGNKRKVSYTSPTYGLFGLSWMFYLIIVAMIIVWYFLKKKKRNNIRFNV